MALFDLFGRRWAMGVVWTLSEQGPCTFRRLQALCDTISPGVLNTRLKELILAGFVERSDAGYRVTKLGEDAYRALQPLSAFSKRWAKHLPD